MYAGQKAKVPESGRVESNELTQQRKELLGSFFLFTRVFFELHTGREFIVSTPVGNRPHVEVVCEAFTDAFLLNYNRLMINLPPGWHKSTICQMFIAWCYAHYPDCRFLYVSHSFELAASHTHSVKKIMMLPMYKKLFGVQIRKDQSAKDFFETTQGGAIAAFGAKGSITGRDGGLPGLPRFSGALIIDDLHKPDEVHSDTIRDKIERNYFETLEPRLRDSENVPIIFIGQMLHEADMPSKLMTGIDGQEWHRVVIEGLASNGHSRYPEVISTEKLTKMKTLQPYVFASQYQQNPIPAGGALFKEDWFELMDEEPELLCTFITGDSSETEKTYNDATAFTFFGLYKIRSDGIDVDMYGLHILDCIEEWVEPKDLEELFLDFYAACMRHKTKPRCVAIEKKSTGVTLVSVLKKRQGLHVIDIERTASSGSKTARFLEMQPFIAARQISLPRYGKHTAKVIKHMTKITANDTHSRDDICDTISDAIKIALIDQFFIRQVEVNVDRSKKAEQVMGKFLKLEQLRKGNTYGSYR